MNIKCQTGTTLIEILIATFVFTIAVGGLLSSILAIVNLIDLANDITVATASLNNMMERIRATPFAYMTTRFPDSQPDGTAENPYQDIVGGYTLTNEQITATYANINVDPLEMKVTLQWNDKRGHSRNISMSTFKTR